MRSRGATVLKLVALDMDGTLVDVASSWAAIHHHFQDHNADGLRDFLAGRIDDHEFIRTDVRIWQRHLPELRVEDLEAILARVPLMPGASTLIAGLKARGVRTAIVSGGIDLLAHRIARELGIDLTLANGFRVTADGRLTGEGIVRVPIKGKEGVLAGLQHQLGTTIEETASVGNSEIDVGLFHRSRMGVAFLPEDEAVRRAATRVVTQKDLGLVLDALREFSDS
ncbi:MAG: HAD-IB family phosphatase [Thermoplasmata archaeon]|nr:HAD-IB family phosphatase [Thermoplasmata archaeon]